MSDTEARRLGIKLLASEQQRDRELPIPISQGTLELVGRVLESVTDAFIALDATDAYIYINRHAEGLLGHSRDALLGRNIWECFPYEVGTPFYLSILQARAERGPVTCENYVATLGLWMENQIYPSEDGLVSVYFRDITARKEVEEEQASALTLSQQRTDELESLIEQMPAAVYVGDEHGITSCNSLAIHMLGFGSHEAVPALAGLIQTRDAGTGETLTLEQEPFIRALRGEACTEDVRVRNIQTGTEMLVRCHAAPLRKDGQIVAAVALNTDITTSSLSEARANQTFVPVEGVLDQRAFDERFKAEMARAQHEGSTFAVIRLSVAALTPQNTPEDLSQASVTARLRAFCRHFDTLAHFSEGEYALLLPSVGSEAVVGIEARLQAALNVPPSRLSRAMGMDALSVSLGTALFQGADSKGRDLLMVTEEIMQLADERRQWSRAFQDAEEIAQRVRTKAMAQVQHFPALGRLVGAAEDMDGSARRHGERVMQYSLMIGQKLGMAEPEMQNLSVAALIHDVGEIMVDVTLLRKPGLLTDDEYEAVKLHAEIGAAMVAAANGLDELVGAIRHHHERWDGRGYPDGLAGAETPLLARILAVAESFDAMTTSRPERDGLGRKTALSILEAGAGSQWDPQCVQAFSEAIAVMQSLET